MPNSLENNPRTLVVIVNYRVGALVVDCLRSLLHEVDCSPKAVDVVVVDNLSGDDSVALIGDAIREHGWGSWARLIEAPVNGGFAYGNNLAIRDARARGQAYDFYWLLNPDTVARSGALTKLLSFIAERPQVGIVGSGVEEDDSGELWPFVFRFPNVLSEFESSVSFGPITRLLSKYAVLRPAEDDSMQVDWLSGCSFLVRDQVFQSIGLLDENYFLYYEETDFCRRAERAGWQCWYVPASRVRHMAGRSTGVSGDGAMQRRVPAYWFESRRRYFRKHHSHGYNVLADAGVIVAMSFSHVRCFLQRKSDVTPPHYLKDFIRHSALFNRDIPLNPRLEPDADAGSPA